MAFTTIAWDGLGVIADCDALSDTQGGTWAEDGAGGISANSDNYLLPPASIGHVYASKSGFGYYTAPATYDFTPTTGAQSGQFIYIWIQIQSASAFDTLANNGFSFVVGTNITNYRTYKLAGSGAGEGKPFDGGGWKLFVIDPTIAGSIADTGTYSLSTINMVGLWMDTIVSVRADTIFIDQISIGKGLRVTGTGTIDEIVDYCTDYTNRAWGVFQKRGSIAFAYGGLTVGDSTSATINTALTDSGNVVEFGYTEFWNGTTWALTHPATYNTITLEKHASYTTDYTSTNTSLFGSDGAELAISTDAGSTISLTGGQLKEMTSLTTLSGQTYSGKILSAIDASSISNTPTDCTWDLCGLITIESGGGLSGCTVSNSLATSALSTTSLNVLSVCSFVSDGTGHGVNLGTISSTQSMNWNNDDSGYTAASSGNETILVSVDNGITLTINVGSGYSTPSVYNTGTGTVSVVSGQVTTKVTVKHSDGSLLTTQNANVLLEAASGGPLSVGTDIIKGYTDINGEIQDIRSFASDQPVVGWVRKGSGTPYYKQYDLQGTIDNASGLNLIAQMIDDE